MVDDTEQESGAPEPDSIDEVEEQAPEKARVLLVDDEERYRTSLARRLGMRGYHVSDVGDGGEAIRVARQTRPDVVLLDRKMPGMQGEEVLRELKRILPQIQVVMLTGHGSIESATETGRLDAFAYLTKPCDTDELLQTIDAARQEKVYAMARAEIPTPESRSAWTWLRGTQNSRPGIILLGIMLFAGVYLMPTSETLLGLLATEKTGEPGDPIAGYPYYAKMDKGETIAGYYSRAGSRYVKQTAADGTVAKRYLRPEEAAQKAKVMVGVLIVAAMFWATGALPIGFTAMLVGVLMYIFGVFPPNLVAKAYAKDAVLFIMGVLALAVGVGKTGLDRRIGLVLLGTSRSLNAYLFLFLPLLAVTASFLSEHALVAFIVPLLMVVYMAGIKASDLKQDRHLAVLLLLSLNFVANQAGPGSPAAGGRNAIMVGILADYGAAPSFGEWMLYGMPFVPVMALTIALYFFIMVRRKTKVRKLNVAAIVRKESTKLGKMTRGEYIAAAVLVLVIVLWITASSELGMGGPAMLGLVLLACFRLITWKDINGISWDVVLLYAAASAMGVGMAYTGAAQWMASGFVAALPEFLSYGEGLCVASSLFTGLLTNFMSDGATVSALAPITVPMAQISGTHPWMVGFATAFASSFANIFVIGTPNNAIVFSLARDPKTGKQLISLGEFARHGLVVTVLAFGVLWGWTFFGYWRWIGF